MCLFGTEWLWDQVGQKLPSTTPLRLTDPFMGVAYQISHKSDIYIMIHNSSKIIVMK